LSCNVGASTQADKTCGVTSVTAGTGYGCTAEGYSCFTINYFGDWFAAYGCLKDDEIDSMKEVYKQACAADSECEKWNPGGEPKNGYTICKEDDCNPCNNASGVSISIAVKLLTIAAVLSTLA